MLGQSQASGLHEVMCLILVERRIKSASDVLVAGVIIIYREKPKGALYIYP